MVLDTLNRLLNIVVKCRLSPNVLRKSNKVVLVNSQGAFLAVLKLFPLVPHLDPPRLPDAFGSHILQGAAAAVVAAAQQVINSSSLESALEVKERSEELKHELFMTGITPMQRSPSESHSF